MEQWLRPLGALYALDTAEWRTVHTRFVLALGLGWMLDGFEVTLVGNVLPILKNIWHLSSLESTLAISVWLGGILLGAVLFGVAADRFGRKRLFLMTLVLYSFATFCTAFSTNFVMFIALRVVAAIGVGAEYSAVNAAVVELTPVRWRGRCSALVMSFWPLGALLGGGLTLAVLAFLPATVAWRYVFGTGAVIALFTLWARRALPESPRWLISRGRFREAATIIAKISGVATQILHDQDPATHRARSWKASVKTLSRRYSARLGLGAILDISEAGGYYGLFALTPLAIVPALHLSFSGSPVFFLIGGVGALAGALSASWCIEQFGRKRTVTGFYAAAALAVAGIGLAVPAGANFTLGVYMVASAVATGSWVAAYPTFSEIFPTEVRATGIGASVAAGRVAAGLSPPLLVVIAGQYSTLAALVLAAAFYVPGVLAMLLWSWRGPEAMGRPLESLVTGD